MFEILLLGFCGSPSHHALCRFWLFAKIIVVVFLLFFGVHRRTVNRTNLMFYPKQHEKCVCYRENFLRNCFLLCRLTNTFCVIFDLFYYVKEEIHTKFE